MRFYPGLLICTVGRGGPRWYPSKLKFVGYTPVCLAQTPTPHTINYIGSDFLADSGATAHVCRDRELMSDFAQSNDNNVVMTGAGALPVKGYGTCAVVDHKSGHTFILP